MWYRKLAMSNMMWDQLDYNDPTTFEDLFLGIIFDSLKRTNYAAESIDVYNNLVKIKDDLLKKTSYHDDVLRAFDMAVEQLELNFDEFDEDKIQPQSNGDWLEVAESYLGTPYVFGGDSKNGIDCSAFVRKVFPDLPRTANDQMKVGVSIPIDNPLEWEPGDRIYFDMNARLKPGDADHTGIYLGNNEFIQASSSKGVTKTPINDYYRKRIIAVKR